MKRLLTAISLVLGLLLAASAQAQTTSDEVRYIDQKTRKEEKANCTIKEETPAHVVITQGTSTIRDIPVTDVVEVTYDKSIGAGNLADYRRAYNHEAKMLDPTASAGVKRREFDESLAAYKQLREEVKEPTACKRDVQFRMARLLARRSEDDPAQLEPAIAELQKFLKENPNGWQVSQASQILGRLQEAKGDQVAAQATYEELAKAPVPKEVQQEAELLVDRMLIRDNKHAAAQERLQKMAAALQTTDPEYARVQVYLAQCQVAAGKFDQAAVELRKLRDGSADPAVKGLIYNALGDIARQNKQMEEAFWDYLWVDVVYNQDKHEQAKALYYLSKLFVEVKNDPVRAQQCRQRLLEDKELLGQEYQKLAAKEKSECRSWQPGACPCF
jgi:tetratricopeptide (TPR) repeat protein